MFDTVWERFVTAPSTLGPTPGVREEWHRGRARYAVWVLRVDAPAVRDRLDAMIDHLAPHGILPFTDPHVTVFVAGFPTPRPGSPTAHPPPGGGTPALNDPDDVPEATLHAQDEAVRAARLPPPRLVVGGLNCFLSCPFLEILDPHGDLARLRAPLEALRPEVRFAPYLPHLTVGAFRDDRPTGPIARAVEPLRDLPPLHLAPSALELVTFDARESGGALATERVVILSRSRRSK